MHSKWALLACASVAIVSQACPAMALGRQYDIAAGDASRSLAALAHQAGLQLAAPSSDLRGQRTAAVRGEMPVERALEIMLHSTALSARISNGTIIVRRVAPVRQTAYHTVLTPMASAAGRSAATTDESSDSADTGVKDIVVTAQRRSDRLQDTPVAITAFDRDDIQNMNITEAVDLARRTPALTVRKMGTNTAIPLFTIRGVGQNQLYLSFQPSVAVYVDGIYQATSSGALFNGGLFDVGAVEVLKGPQGTLFGRNSTGGAISVTTQAPDDYFDGQIKGWGGSNGQMAMNAAFNVPLGSPDVGLRLVGQYARSDGYGRDLASGRKLNDNDIRSIRGTFRAASGSFEAILRGDYSQTISGGTSIKMVHAAPGSTAVRATALELGIATSPADFTDPAVLEDARMALLAQIMPHRYNVSLNSGVRPLNKNESYGGSFTAGYDLAPTVQIKSISAYRRVHNFIRSDNDGVATVLLETPAYTQKFSQYSQEFQLNGSALDDRLKFATGFFYYRMNGADDLFAATIPALNPRSPSRFFNEIRNVSKSAYGQATFALTHGFSFTGGLRYTDENVRAKSHNAASANGNPSICVVPMADRVPNEPCLGIYDNNFTNWSYTAGIDYRFSSAMMSYAKVSRGFKAGGHNQNGQNTPEAFRPFEPEVATTYEIGLKTELFDRKLRVNAAAYWTDYTNIQRTVFALTGAPGAQTTTSRVENAASARVRGFELELAARPVARVDMNAGVAFTDPGYRKYSVISPATQLPINRAADPFPGVSKWQLNLASSYTAPIGSAELRFGGNVAYQSAQVFDPANATSAAHGYTRQPGYALVDGRITFGIPGEEFDVSLIGSNLFDKRYNIGGTDLTGSLGYEIAIPGAPRTWRIELNKRF